MLIEFCKIWKLKVKINKNQIIIFGTRKNDNFVFRLGEYTIEVVDKYKYLGTYFSKSKSLLNSRMHIAEQAKKKKKKKKQYTPVF